MKLTYAQFNGNQPAAPTSVPVHVSSDMDYSFGLTKREAFAMAAMQGICANLFEDMPNDMIAKNAVIVADATLDELEAMAPTEATHPGVTEAAHIPKCAKCGKRTLDICDIPGCDNIPF